ncbi:MAG: hypothetical protein OFPI_08840 [Osedax symbiont Rs2]|nr:MAG: hypothetical protein OFPI_08840 [Osedax symbiont Rs2]
MTRTAYRAFLSVIEKLALRALLLSQIAYFHSAFCPKIAS